MEITKNGSLKMRVCIVGAGAAGLCATRHLSQRESQFDFDVYEKSSYIGGIWNYTDSVGLDENGVSIHTSMYKNMRTNLPMEIMEFQDFVSNCEESFVSHTQVLNYLEEYAKHFGLFKYIKIIRISRIGNIWRVLIKNIKTKEINEKDYHSIFVCNGRYSKPNVPKVLNGIEKFGGKVIHSHDYRIPEQFSGLNVLVLGGGPSGIDISIEVSEKATNVVLCHQNAKPFNNLPENLKQEMSEVLEITENQIILRNGNRHQINAIIFATGYRFDFSFLDQSCAINVNKYGRVEGIYLQLINQKHPSMAIWAIPMKVVPFPLYNQQVLFFIKCLTHEIILPSEQEMERQTEEDLSLRKSIGLSDKYSHKMSKQLFFDYCDKLSQMANIESFTPVFRQLYTDLDQMRAQDLRGYKNLNFKIISNKKYIICNKNDK